MKEIKINFYCVGAQKAGTTSLHNVLNQHHNVFLPDTKEAHFFDRERITLDLELHSRYLKGSEAPAILASI